MTTTLLNLLKGADARKRQTRTKPPSAPLIMPTKRHYICKCGVLSLARSPFVRNMSAGVLVVFTFAKT